MKSRLALFAILSSIALVAFAMRATAFAQATAAMGGPRTWWPLTSIEVANWFAWSLWAACLVPFAPRLPALFRRGAIGIGALLGLAVIPVVLLPAAVGVVHRTGFSPGMPLVQSYVHVLTHNLPLNLLLGISFVAVTTGYSGLREARALEVAAARLTSELTQAQLEVLRSQLNPHFLFNALNGIAVLARRGQVDRVEEMVDHLASLLRHSLDASRSQHVPLRVEIDALRHYVNIEKVRRGDRLTVTMDVPEGLNQVMVPSLLLQPLVENAVRHGADDHFGPLAVSVRAQADGDHLRLEVTDDGVGLDDRSLRDGVGLGHTRARLAGLYGSDASLVVEPNANSRGTRVEVRLPIRRPASGQPA